MNLVYTLVYTLGRKEAISLMDAKIWQEAINDEINFLGSSET